MSAASVIGASNRTTTSRTAQSSDRWEHGSDFYFSLDQGTADLPWAGGPHTLWGSGRDALRGLLVWGRRVHGWRRILVPSYFCQDVVPALERAVDVAVYDQAPTRPRREPVEAKPGDVLLVVATFGVRPPTTTAASAVVIEDHSHDPVGPAATQSTAHYVAASLRKTMPLPDGGVLWSPRGLDGPSELQATAAHERVAFARLSAMLMKLQYLSGHDVSKETFRALAADGDQRIGRGEISGISTYSRTRLPTLPTAAWTHARAVNLDAFRQTLGALRGVTLLEVPFAATLVFDDPKERDRVRATLIGRRIYPSILWPLDAPVVGGIPAVDVKLARRILSIHCDYRYEPADMRRVATEVREAIGR